MGNEFMEADPRNIDIRPGEFIEDGSLLHCDDPATAHIRYARVLKNSGTRQEFDTGSRRDSREGKGRFDLLPMRALKVVARVFEQGAGQYGDRNWEKGQPLSRYLDSALRHLTEWAAGETSEDHLGHAAWNVLAALETRARCEEGVLQGDLYDIPPILQEGRAVHEEQQPTPKETP